MLGRKCDGSCDFFELIDLQRIIGDEQHVPCSCQLSAVVKTGGIGECRCGTADLRSFVIHLLHERVDLSVAEIVRQNQRRLTGGCQHQGVQQLPHTQHIAVVNIGVAEIVGIFICIERGIQLIVHGDLGAVEIRTGFHDDNCSHDLRQMSGSLLLIGILFIQDLFGILIVQNGCCTMQRDVGGESICIGAQCRLGEQQNTGNQTGNNSCKGSFCQME